VNWINLVKVRDQWKAFANKVMNFRSTYDVGNFVTARRIVTFEEGLGPIELEARFV
jgi:hypothetical protein